MMKILLIALVALCLLLTKHSSAISIMTQASGEECFFDHAERGEKVYGSFSVYSGGALDIDVTISGPDGRIVYAEERVEKQSFTFVALETGKYTLCFSNSRSSVTTKMISFSFVVGNSLADHEIAKEEHLTPIENAVIVLSQGSKAVKDELRYLKVRDRVSRKTNDSTYSRVLWTNLFEMVVLVSISLWKIFYIRSLFEQKR